MDIIVINLNNYKNLMNGKNIVYYKCSETNTWLPFGGVYDNNKIIKMSDINEENINNYCYKWVFDLLKKYYLEYIFNFNDLYENLFTFIFTETYISSVHKYTMKLKNTDDIDRVMLYFTEFLEIYKFISSHFLFVWQLYINILLDKEDGFWNKNKNPFFKHFIHEEFRNVYNFNIDYIVHKVNVQDITAFLKENESNYTLHELLSIKNSYTVCKNVKNVIKYISGSLKNRKNELISFNIIKNEYIKNKWI